MITGQQLISFLKANKYISVRLASGHEYGVNCGILNIKRFRKKAHKRPTLFQSLRAISFQEYISIKHPFLKSKRNP